jgi:hypothetical protein
MNRDRSAQPYKEGEAHGTKTGYSNGCRCERCATASRDYERRKRAGIATPRPDPVPLAPLLDRLSGYIGASVEQLGVDTIAEACGVDRRTVLRWRSCGRVPERDIDDIATRLGWHPAAIWGAHWYITTTYYDEATA